MYNLKDVCQKYFSELNLCKISDQYNFITLAKYDYSDVIALHLGTTSSRNDSLSWVSHNENLTFDNVIDNILVSNIDNISVTNGATEQKTSKIYLPLIGECLQYKHSLKHGNKVLISTTNLYKPVVVYVTDPHFTTNYGLQFQSQSGDKIK